MAAGMKNRALPVRWNPLRHVDVVAPHIGAVDYGVQVPAAAVTSELLTLESVILLGRDEACPRWGVPTFYHWAGFSGLFGQSQGCVKIQKALISEEDPFMV